METLIEMPRICQIAQDAHGLMVLVGKRSLMEVSNLQNPRRSWDSSTSQTVFPCFLKGLSS